MAVTTKIEPLDCSNLAKEWPRFEMRFMVHLRREEMLFYQDDEDATKKDDAAKKKEAEEKESFRIGAFYSAIGAGGQKIFGELYPTIDYQFVGLQMESVLKEFRGHCVAKKNLSLETFKFQQIKQQEDQRFEEFFLELKKQAADCEFKCKSCSVSYEERMMKDQIVAGVRDERLRLRLFDKQGNTLDDTVNQCKNFEESHRNVKALDKEPERERDHQVDVVNRACFGCGYTPWTVAHKEICAMKDVVCYTCNGKGHRQATCKRGRAAGDGRARGGGRGHFPRSHNKDVNTVGAGQFNAGVWEVRLKGRRSWMKSYRVNNNIVDFKLDTGAEANLIPIRFVKGKIQHSDIKLFDYNKRPVKVFGEVVLDCLDCKSQKNYSATFVVVENRKQPILGSESCIDFNVIRRVDLDVDRVQVETPEDNFMRANASIFQGLGKLPGKVSIVLKENSKPVVHYKKRFPLSMLEKLKVELKDMEEKGIISPVDGPTDWVNNLQVIEKPNGRLRVCIDPRPLNECIKREHFMIPTIEDLVSEMVGHKVFSSMDLKSGFWQLELDEESSLLTTCMTPCGRYKFNRVPFGISCIPELFQKKMVQIFGDIKGVTIYFDDFSVSGKTDEEHDAAMAEVIKRARANNITFNCEKMQYKRKEITFMGHIISEGSIRVNAKNKESISNMQTPVDKDGVHRFLGLLKYVTRFIPNLSKETAGLRNLTQNNVKFKWEDKHKKEFDELKEFILSDQVLAIYDPSKEVTIETDASKNGLGCVITQEGRPVSYASRTLSKSEIKFSQIEKELLAIVFACTRFHYYLYGRAFVVESDHKPLESLFKKDIDESPIRLQRMMTILLRYPMMKVIHKPGKEMHVADCLSRAQIDDIEEIEELNDMIHVITRNVCGNPHNLNHYQEALKRDGPHQKIREYVESGWPGYHKLDQFSQQFYKIKNELHYENGLLLWGHRLIIPPEVQGNISRFIHSSHLGIEKTLLRAKSLYYWPGMTKQITEIVESCRICEKFARNNAREPLKPDVLPRFPFHITGMDLFEYGGKDYVSILDSYSNYLVSIPLENKTSGHIIKKIKNCFEIIGFPSVIRADNSPFASQEFKQYAEENNIQFKFSSPRYAQSNGLAEKGVAIAKNILKRCIEAKDNYQSLILEYNNTPVASLGMAPSQLFFGRILKTRLPVAEQVLVRRNVEERIVKQKIEMRRGSQKKYYDKGTKELNLFKPGDKVMFKKNDKDWKYGIVDKALSDRSYVVKDGSGQHFRRNRVMLRKTRNEDLDVYGDVSLDDLGEDSDSNPELSTLQDQTSGATTSPSDSGQEELTSEERRQTRCGREVRLPARFRQ